MKHYRAPLVALMILSSSLAIACAGETPADSAAEPSAGEAVAEVAAPVAEDDADEPDAHEAGPRADGPREKGEKKDRARAGRAGKGGPMALLVSAVRELDLTDAQETTLAELRKSMAADGKGRPNDGALAKALAGAIESGTVDVAAFDSELDAIETRAAEQATAMQSALNQLHATLTPEQRTELVEVIDERTGDMRPRKRADKGKAKARDGGAGVLGMLSHELELTEEQKTKLKELREELDQPEQPERGAELKTLIESFPNEDFDAKKIGLGEAAGKMARARAEHMITSVSKVVPILDEAQRGKLADIIEKRMSGMKKRGKGGKGKRPGLQ